MPHTTYVHSGYIAFCYCRCCFCFFLLPEVANTSRFPHITKVFGVKHTNAQTLIRAQIQHQYMTRPNRPIHSIPQCSFSLLILFLLFSIFFFYFPLHNEFENLSNYGKNDCSNKKPLSVCLYSLLAIPHSQSRSESCIRIKFCINFFLQFILSQSLQ